MSTSQKPKNRPFRPKAGKPGAAAPRADGPQGGRRGRGKPPAGDALEARREGKRPGRPERDADGGRQPRSNASAMTQHFLLISPLFQTACSIVK